MTGRTSLHWRFLILCLLTMGMEAWSCDLARDENGRNFSRTVPFRFLYFSVRFRIYEIPFLYLRK
jgi:hypothetical protein